MDEIISIVLLLRKLNELEKRLLDLELQFKINVIYDIYENNRTYKNNVRDMNCNVGEADEISIIKMLCEESMSTSNNKLVDIFGVDASDGVVIINPITNRDYASISEIKKSPHIYKTDVVVLFKKNNMRFNISIKSHRGGLPAIVNHTPRSANVFSGALCDEVRYLDVLISEYIVERKSGNIGEDVKLLSLKSMSDVNINISVMRLLDYFIFDGSGRCDSKMKANGILVFNRNALLFTRCDTVDNRQKYIKNILNSCVLSLRDKGMPKITTPSHEPWIYMDRGIAKGSLHIRLRKV